MKKAIFIFSIIALALALPAAAGKPNPAADNGLTKGGSDVNHLYLFEKDPVEWFIVEDGASGKMKFDTDSFVFNGHGLEPGMDYALIYYPDPWPGIGTRVLGTGTTNKGGNINIKGDFDFSEIPSHVDENEGAKIWLVLMDDIAELDDQPHEGYTFYRFVGWNPSEYLFEYDLVNQP